MKKPFKQEIWNTVKATHGRVSARQRSLIVGAALIAILSLIGWLMDSCTISHMSSIQLKPNQPATDSTQK